MKLSIYSRSLIYATLWVFGVLLLLRIFFPSLQLFSDYRILVFSLIAIGLSYIFLILLYKNVSSKIAKTAYRKTTQKHQEKSLKATKDREIQLTLLKDREKYRREFLGNVSHELKTPLFTIQSYILTLIDGAVKDKKIRNIYLSRINKSVDRLIYIVRDLDILADIESGNFQLEHSPFDLTQVTQEVFEFLEIKAQENHVKLSIISSLQPNQKVYADRERIAQVLTNLVANAITYTAHKENAEVQVKLSASPQQIHIEVADNGQGIDPKHQARVFERFYRTDVARSREKGGSGLGLAIVKNILEAHQSKISLESSLGEGSQFRFALPMAQ